MYWERLLSELSAAAGLECILPCLSSFSLWIRAPECPPETEEENVFGETADCVIVGRESDACVIYRRQIHEGERGEVRGQDSDGVTAASSFLRQEVRWRPGSSWMWVTGGGAVCFGGAGSGR